MARTCTYLNFARSTEAAFEYYRSVFGGAFINGISRFGDMPPMEGMPSMPEADKNLVMHVELAITGGHVLMGTDAPESMGFNVNAGNNIYIQVEPDTRAEADRIFAALSAGGRTIMPMQPMFWGAYFGSCADQFGVQWNVSCMAAA